MREDTLRGAVAAQAGQSCLRASVRHLPSGDSLFPTVKWAQWHLFPARLGDVAKWGIWRPPSQPDVAAWGAWVAILTRRPQRSCRLHSQTPDSGQPQT